MASYLKFTTAYSDGTERNIQIGEIDTDSIDENIRQKIKDFNVAATRQGLYPNFDNSFVSENGAPFTAIKAAEIITTERNYYF